MRDQNGVPRICHRAISPIDAYVGLILNNPFSRNFDNPDSRTYFLQYHCGCNAKHSSELLLATNRKPKCPPCVFRFRFTEMRGVFSEMSTWLKVGNPIRAFYFSYRRRSFYELLNEATFSHDSARSHWTYVNLRRQDTGWHRLASYCSPHARIRLNEAIMSWPTCRALGRRPIGRAGSPRSRPRRNGLLWIK